MDDNKYVVVTALDYRDELYKLTKSKVRQFESLFGNFNNEWENHYDAVKWVRKNGKLVNYCVVVANN